MRSLIAPLLPSVLPLGGWTTPTAAVVQVPSTSKPSLTSTSTPMPTDTPTLTATPTETAATTETPTPTRRSTPSPTPTAGSQVVVLAEVVNLRSGPGLTCKVVSTVKQGKRLLLLGRDNQGTWYQVESHSGAAWIYGGDLSTANRELDEIPEVVAPICPTPTPIPTPTYTPTPTETPRPPTPPMVAGQVPTLEQIANCPAGLFPEAPGVAPWAATHGQAFGLLVGKGPGQFEVSVEQVYDGQVVTVDLSDFERLLIRQVIDRSRYPLCDDSWAQINEAPFSRSIEQV